MALSDVLTELRADAHFMAGVTAWQTRPRQPARYAPMPESLHPAVQEALHRRGIRQLYTHQAQAIELALAGQDLAVVTPTASGKTLCYNGPVLHALLADPAARALFLFPTKALAQDQLAELRRWQATLARDLDIATYDGDTPGAERAQIRRTARALLTNPDMLHTGILPYHPHWADFFAGLRYVVIDEMHTYRGVFGSHVANVLRRLQRVCAHYGSRPQFICTSATIANPGELAGRLLERPVTVVDDNGAPWGEKHLILYNPPLYDPERGLRRSSVLEAQALAARCILHGVQTIVFGRSRLTTEVLLTYLRERVGRDRRRGAVGDPRQAIRGYRGGYLPEERRRIEAGLRQGQVRGVVATNALELGIDIGQLQAAILCGYPGTIASTWQQMGRAGRTLESSLAVLVATAGPLDQYVVQHPEFLFDNSPEQALIHPDNLMLLVDQMRCSAFELPFQDGESLGASPFGQDVLHLLAEQGQVQHHGHQWFWSGPAYPARQVSLRSAGSETVAIQAGSGADSTIIGEIDQISAPRLLHEEAIYLHEGQSYRVEKLDLEAHLAQVTPVDVEYYTEVSTETNVTILAELERRPMGGALTAHGELQVSSQVVGFRRIRRFTHETLGVFPLDFPPMLLETSGYWLSVSPEAQSLLEEAGHWFDSPNDYGPNWEEQRQRVRARDGYRCARCGAPEPPGRQHDVHHQIPFRTFGYVPGRNERYKEANQLENLLLVCRTCHRRLEMGVRVRGGLDGLAYVLGQLAPLYLMCDRQDLDVHVSRGGLRGAPGLSPGTGAETAVAALDRPTIFIYERAQAGLGFSSRLYELHDRLLAAAQEQIERCPCLHGCPACVGPVLEQGQVWLPTKTLARALLQVLRTGQIHPRGPAPTDDIAF